MAAGSDIFNRIQKVILIVLIIAAVPLLGLYMIMPRLSIVPGLGDAQFNFVDITVANFTSDSGYPVPGYDENVTDTATLDFWIEVGLPLKEGVTAGSGSYDARYYYENGTVNEDNLADPTKQLVVPIIKVTAKYQNTILGTGGSVRQYVLNAEHPVEYVHLYLTGSRMPNGGLMYLFNALASNGVLDTILMGALLGSESDEDPFSALLADLQLELTAYLGGAPLSLPLDFSALAGSPFPCVDASSASAISTSAFEMPGPASIYYKHNETVDSMDRFTGQLGLSDVEGLLTAIGLTDISQILNMFNQMFTDDDLYLNVTTLEPYWINGRNATSNLVYSMPDLESRLFVEIQDFKNTYDTNNTIDIVSVEWSLGDKTSLDALLAAFDGDPAILNTRILTNATSWYTRRHVDALMQPGLDGWLFVPATAEEHIGLPSETPKIVNVTNTARGGEIVTISFMSTPEALFEIMAMGGYGIADFFQGLDKDVPQVLTGLLFKPTLPLYGMEVQEKTLEDWIAITPEIGGIDSEGLLLVTIIGAFVLLFLIFAITKGSVKLNRSDFLGRENVARNVKDLISRVEQLGGKVSVQNAESLVIRAFRMEGKIDKPADVEKRAKTYVENQKLLVTLQSRASRAYVAQKFKDCIGAIEKMIQIAKKLEDQTLVQNYEENLAKVVRLLRRKGISVSTKVRVEEGTKPGDEVEQLAIYKKELIDLQNRASKAFAEKNFSEAKESIKQMLAIAKKIQDPVLIRNYEANLRKIIAMEKGGSV